MERKSENRNIKWDELFECLSIQSYCYYQPITSLNTFKIRYAVQKKLSGFLFLGTPPTHKHTHTHTSQSIDHTLFHACDYQLLNQSINLFINSFIHSYIITFVLYTSNTHLLGSNSSAGCLTVITCFEA